MTKLKSLARARVIGPEGGAEDGATGAGVGEGVAGVDLLVVSSLGRSALERGGVRPRGRSALERGRGFVVRCLALERGGSSPEGAEAGCLMGR
jgi:hypothetical protein